MGILLKNGKIVDPKLKTITSGDLFLENAVIAPAVPDDLSGHQVIDCTGLMIAPGLIDMHVHLRDPGLTYKEDIVTGTAAAAAGGVTTVCCMPNTKPVIDTPELIRYASGKGENEASARVLPIGAVTVGQKGTALTDFPTLKDAGACAFSDDGVPVMSAVIMRNALKAAKPLGKIVISHCEDGEMVQNYAVNEGEVSKKLGLPGRPAIAEDLMVARDLMLAEETGAHVHIAHVSTAGSVRLIREAKARGVSCSAETCPQYFIYTEEELLKKGTLARVNPPLRTESDRQAILEGLLDSTLDCIVTDHAPHSAEEKARPLPDAPSGMVGLETSLAACLTYLVKPGHMTIPELIARMSLVPAQILGLPYGTLAPGAAADICVFDPEEVWTVDPEQFRSKARNTIFAGEALAGRVRLTICGGKITYQV
ncbi:MAG: dihydroorotase [Oscillospiraceae bacterium]|nr:dihydroorotase [Oscillospiraceae bacterium]